MQFLELGKILNTVLFVLFMIVIVPDGYKCVKRLKFPQ